MITIRIPASLILVLAVFATTLFARPIAGPKGGRILTTEAPHAEFLVQKDRTVLVSFYDPALKPIGAGGRTVSAVAEAKSGKVRLDFFPQDGGLVSKGALPDGDDYTIVVQIRDNPAARPRNYRVLFHDEICPDCQRAEYACTCEDAGKAHGHEHKKS